MLQLSFARMLTRRLALVLGALMFAAPVWADKDEARLAAYRLDKATLVKMEAALTGMAEAVRKQPSLAREDDKDDKEPTIAEIAAFYNSKPPLKKAIESAGMTADSFTVAAIAWSQAAMASALAQSVPAAKRAKAIADTGVPPANVAFVEANKEAMARMNAKLQALQGK